MRQDTATEPATCTEMIPSQFATVHVSLMQEKAMKIHSFSQHFADQSAADVQVQLHDVLVLLPDLGVNSTVFIIEYMDTSRNESFVLFFADDRL
jgi:hypothetical protein